MAKDINIGGRLHSIATGNVVAGADEILDDNLGKKQTQINTETYSLVESVNNALDELNPDQQEALAVATKANANEAKLGYYVCDTDADVAAKTIVATNYVLGVGGSIKVKMTNNNTADNATLNINSTGAKALFYEGARASSTNTWADGDVLEIYYDGTNYQAKNVRPTFKTGEKVNNVGVDDKPTAGSDNLIKGKGVANIIFGGDIAGNKSAFEEVAGRYITVNGSVSSNSNYVMYKMLVRNFTDFIVEARLRISNSLIPIAFYSSEDIDKDKLMEESVVSPSDTERWENFTATIPIGCKLVVISNRIGASKKYIPTINWISKFKGLLAYDISKMQIQDDALPIEKFDSSQIDEVPVKESEHLVKSKGVYSEVHNLKPRITTLSYNVIAGSKLQVSNTVFFEAGSKISFRADSSSISHIGQKLTVSFKNSNGVVLNTELYFSFNTYHTLIFDEDVTYVSFYKEASAIIESTSFDFTFVCDKSFLKRGDLDKEYINDKYVPTSVKFVTDLIGESAYSKSTTLNIGEKDTIIIENINVSKGSLLQLAVNTDKPVVESMMTNVVYSDETSNKIYYPANKIFLIYAEKDISAIYTYIAPTATTQNTTTFSFDIHTIKLLEYNAKERKYSTIFSCSNKLIEPIGVSFGRSSYWANQFNNQTTRNAMYSLVDRTRRFPKESFAYYRKLETNRECHFGERPSPNLISKHFILDENNLPSIEYDANIGDEYRSAVAEFLNKWDGVTDVTYEDEVTHETHSFTYKAVEIELFNEVDSTIYQATNGFGLSWYNDGVNCVPAINISGNRIYDDQNRPMFFYQDIAKEQIFIALRIAYQAIKSVSKDALVIMYSTTMLTEKEQFLRDYLSYIYTDDNNVQHRVWEYFDILQSHYYPDHESAKTKRYSETFIERLTQFKSILNEYDIESNGVRLCNKPIHITEYGVQNSSALVKEQTETEEEFEERKIKKDFWQASSLIKGILYAYSMGVQSINIYIFASANGSNDLNLVELDSNYSNIIKYYPSYYGVKYLHKILTHNSERPTLLSSNGYYKAEWNNANGQNIKAFWTKKLELDFYIECTTVYNIVDMFGNPIIITNNTLTLNSNPIYVIDCPCFNLIIKH